MGKRDRPVDVTFSIGENGWERKKFRPGILLCLFGE